MGSLVRQVADDDQSAYRNGVFNLLLGYGNHLQMLLDSFCSGSVSKAVTAAELASHVLAAEALVPHPWEMETMATGAAYLADKYGKPEIDEKDLQGNVAWLLEQLPLHVVCMPSGGRAYNVGLSPCVLPQPSKLENPHPCLKALSAVPVRWSPLSRNTWRPPCPRLSRSNL